MPKSSTSLAIGISAILTNVILWGLAPPLIKLSLNDVSPEIFLYYRFLFSSILGVMIIWMIPRLFAQVKKGKDLFKLTFIGLFTNPLCLLVLFIALQYTSAFSAAVITSLVPLFVIIGSGIFLGESISKKAMGGIVLASIGTIFVILDAPAEGQASNALLGNLLCLGHNLLWTTGILLMKKYAKAYHPFAFGVTGWMIGFLVLGVFSLVTDPIIVLRPLMLTQLPIAMWSIIYMAVFGSLIAFTAYQIAQQHLTASATSVFSYLQPVVTLPVAYLLLDEIPQRATIIGCVLILIGVLWTEKQVLVRRGFRVILRKILK